MEALHSSQLVFPNRDVRIALTPIFTHASQLSILCSIVGHRRSFFEHVKRFCNHYVLVSRQKTAAAVNVDNEIEPLQYCALSGPLKNETKLKKDQKY